jgi:hypothetical protein
MLPGTNRSADRFVRASFYINAVPKTSDNAEAVVSAFSVIRNVSVPLGISTPGQPNISSTIWRTVSDHKYKRYFSENVRLLFMRSRRVTEIFFSGAAAVSPLAEGQSGIVVARDPPVVINYVPLAARSPLLRPREEYPVYSFFGFAARAAFSSSWIRGSC